MTSCTGNYTQYQSHLSECFHLVALQCVICFVDRASLYNLFQKSHPNQQTRQPPIQSEKYQCHIDIVGSPDDGHIVAQNMYRSWNKYTKKQRAPSWLHLKKKKYYMLDAQVFLLPHCTRHRYPTVSLAPRKPEHRHNGNHGNKGMYDSHEVIYTYGEMEHYTGLL